MDWNLFTIIAKYCDFRTLLALRSTCTGIRKRVRILEIPKFDSSILRDSILLLFPHLVHLDASFNHNITDASIAKLPELIVLDASCNVYITDASVSLLKNLEYLNASRNPMITDASIALLGDNIHLIADDNPYITKESSTNLSSHYAQKYNPSELYYF